MKTHTVPWDAHTQAHTQVSLRVQFIARTESLYFDFCFFNYYMFLVSGNFSLKHFSLNIIRMKFKTWLIIKYFRKNMLLISFLKKNITYHYLIRTYFHVRTFTNNVSVRSQPEPPGWYIDSWPWTVPLGVEPHCQLPSLLVQWYYRERNTHAIRYNYGDIHRQIHGERSLNILHSQVEQRFWGFIWRFEVKHSVLRSCIHCRIIWVE